MIHSKDHGATVDRTMNEIPEVLDQPPPQMLYRVPAWVLTLTKQLWDALSPPLANKATCAVIPDTNRTRRSSNSLLAS